MGAFGDLLDDLFTDDDFSDAAVYVPAAGEPSSVRIVRRARDVDIGFGQAINQQEQTLIEIRVSDIADPRVGDRIELGAGGPSAEAWIVKAKPARDDVDKLVWSLNVRPR